MSWFGASYGTSIASVYASIYPAVTHRVVMDGVVNPRPEAAARSDSSARGIQSVWNGLVKDCESSLARNLSTPQRCPAAPGVSLKTWHVLRGQRANASQLLELMFMSAFRAQALGPLAMACVEQFYSGKALEACEKILPHLPLNKANSSNSSNSSGRDRFGLSMQSMVMGTDSVGRYDEEDFIRWWKGVKDGQVKLQNDAPSSFGQRFF